MRNSAKIIWLFALPVMLLSTITVSGAQGASPVPSPSPTTSAQASPSPSGTPATPPVVLPSAAPAPLSTGLVAYQIGTQILVSWKLPATKITSQTLSISPASGNGIKPIALSASARSYTFTGLLANQPYTVSLSTLKPLKMYTAKPVLISVLSAPVELKADRLGANTVDLFWKRISSRSNDFGALTGIQVTVASQGLKTIVYNPKLNSGMLKIDNILPSNTYTISMQYLNVAGYSTPAVVTLQQMTPVQPSKPVATVLTTSVAKVDWTYSGTTFTAKQAIKIISSTGGKRNGDVVSVSTSSQSATFDGLTPAGKYVFEIVLTNRFGSSTPVDSDPIAMLVPPMPPINVSVVPSNASATVSWNPPIDSGGVPVSSYLIEYRPDGVAAYTAKLSATGSAHTQVVPSLVNGQKYYFRVTAVTSFASSVPSAEVSASPSALPNAITNLTAKGGAESVALSWTAPVQTNASPIISYTVQYKLSAASVWLTYPVSPLTATSVSIPGLVDGSFYSFQVQAVNIAGVSPFVSATATPFANPGVPTAFQVTPGNGMLTAHWTAPVSLGGSPLKSYTVQYKVATDSLWITLAPTSASTSQVISNLANGLSYQVQVATVAGTTTNYTSAFTSPVAATPATLPGTPTNLVATPATLSANLSWVEPASNGGSNITGYKVEYKTNSASTWTVAAASVLNTNYAVTNLTSGTTYNFRVSAINSIGTGTVTASVNAAIA